jgi:murein L,D-transpeptidase YafK
MARGTGSMARIKCLGINIISSILFKTQCNLAAYSMKNIVIQLVFGLIVLQCQAQTQMVNPNFPDNSFYNIQAGQERVKNALLKHESTWKKIFDEKKLNFPNTQIFLRSFKADGKLEVWARNTSKDTFTFLKDFPICVLSGNMGPKRREGDKQVPEGFYWLDEFNARSNYHLSLQVSYPNYSDLMKGDKERPGNDIMIHGSCVTIGCIPITDEMIAELYSICIIARTNGQFNIPVHVFPTRFNRRGLDYLGAFYKQGNGVEDNQKFWTNLKRGYDYFEQKRMLMPILYDEKGNYVY